MSGNLSDDFIEFGGVRTFGRLAKNFHDYMARPLGVKRGQTVTFVRPEAVSKTSRKSVQIRAANKAG